MASCRAVGFGSAWSPASGATSSATAAAPTCCAPGGPHERRNVGRALARTLHARESGGPGRVRSAGSVAQLPAGLARAGILPRQPRQPAPLVLPGRGGAEHGRAVPHDRAPGVCAHRRQDGVRRVRGVAMAQLNGRVPTPALNAWRRELAAGARTKYTFDALWRAACEDMNALEAAGAGLPGLARSFPLDAQRSLRYAEQ